MKEEEVKDLYYTGLDLWESHIEGLCDQTVCSFCWEEQDISQKQVNAQATQTLLIASIDYIKQLERKYEHKQKKV